MEILRGVATTIRFPTLGEDSPSFPNLEKEAPVISIVRDSTGTEVKEPPEAKVKETGGETFYELTIPASLTQEADLLYVTWSDKQKAEGEVVNSYKTRVEVVGGFIASVESIQEKLGENPTNERVRMARELATREIENACGVAFRPRYERDILDGKGTKRLLLRRRELNSVIAVKVEGIAMAPADIAALELDPVGVLQSEAPWPVGRGNLEVLYVHGHQYFTPAITPVRDYTAHLLSSHPSDWQGRATSYTNEFGASYSLVTPGVRGARFPLPSVNSFVQEFAEPLVA